MWRLFPILNYLERITNAFSFLINLFNWVLLYHVGFAPYSFSNDCYWFFCVVGFRHLSDYMLVVFCENEILDSHSLFLLSSQRCLRSWLWLCRRKTRWHRSCTCVTLPSSSSLRTAPSCPGCKLAGPGSRPAAPTAMWSELELVSLALRKHEHMSTLAAARLKMPLYTKWLVQHYWQWVCVALC